MKINIKIRKIISCIFAALFIFIFAIYCSGRVGWFLLLTLVLTPVFSVLLTYLCKNSLEVKASIDHDLMSKGDHCVLTVTVKNKGILPCPPVKVKIKNDPAVTILSDEEICLSVLPKRSSSAFVSFMAKLAGGAMIGIDSVIITDYFGICSYTPERGGQYLFKTGVIPDIIRMPAATDLLLSASDAFASDKTDETVNDIVSLSGGFPGYEYREYRPQDPLKRINSKMSAKRDRLMVRLDERQASSDITVILDPFMKESDPELSQTVLEETAGLILTLINLDLSVTFFYMTDGKWLQEKIWSEDTLISLLRKLAFHMFLDRTDFDLPLKSTDENTGTIICQAEFSSETTGKLSGEGIHIYASSSGEWRHLR
ncbi:MAG: DUF58 domain-containing protein [Lachnospiraceae bacterium]|nr:DUF58 domain-containing protein [Lachnospiraceae bacterium]